MERTSTQFDAVYENGVLRPLKPVELPEHERLSVSVNWAADPLADVRDRPLRVIRVRVPEFKLADKLLQKHGMTSKLRTLDSLQLATALDLRERAMQITLSALTGICAGSRRPKGYLSSIPKRSESWQEHAEEAPIIRTKFKN